MRTHTLCLVLVLLTPACSDSSSVGDGGPGCDAARDGAGTPGDGSLPTTDQLPADLPPGARRIFVTSTKHDGNLGGLAGGDSICAQAAAAAGLGGQWVAWLSTKSVDAIDRLTLDGPWHDLTGKRIFADKAALADLTTDPDNGLWIDETGSFMASDRIWTGTGPDGKHVDSIGDSCQGWTSAAMSDQARIGQVGRHDYSWTSFSFTTCDQSTLHLICFEQ